MDRQATENPFWQRVAGLKPRLRNGLRIYRHHYRGRPWYVLHDPTSARHYRFTARAHHFIGLMDGFRTVEQAREAVNTRSAGAELEPEDIIHLLARLNASGMLRWDASPAAADVFARGPQRQSPKWQQALMRPLAVRFPLLDPERFLTRALPLVRPILSRSAFLVWLLVVGAAVTVGAAHWPELTAHWSSRALDPRNLLLLALLYPVVKALHELGHAFATKAWGGEVHEMGIMLLVLMPIPYMDASAANAFRHKRERMAVAAAGIMVEVFLAAAAFFLWLQVQPGLVRDIAYNIILIGGASTVLFNANPLLRFDGYYILADAIEIPNLGSRSIQYLAYLVKRYAFGLSETPSPVTARGERPWFVIYGVAASLYRVFITFAIALFVAGKFFVLGVVLAMWALATQILHPLGKQLGFLLFSPTLKERRYRAGAIVATAVVALAGLINLVPVPLWTSAEGLIRLPQRSLVRAGTDGFVIKLLGPAGETVQEGSPLFALEDPLLDARVSILEWRLKELQARRGAEFLTDRMQAEIYQEEIADVQAELAEARARRDKLMVYSPVTGTFMVPGAEDLPGRFVRKGDRLGYVVDVSSMTARVVVPQTAVDLIRRRTESVEVRLPNRPGTSIPADIQREVPSATNRLPSRVLGTQGGGAIAVDSRDAEGVIALDRVFQFDLELPPKVPGGYVGSRVYVRFNHGREPLAWRWYRRLRQLFLARMQV